MKTAVLAFATTSIFAVLSIAQDVDDNDVPSACQQVCAPVVSLSQRCDNNNEDDDAQLNCICTAENASAFIPECEACVAANDEDGNDNDVNDLRTSCSFTSAMYTATQTSASSGSPTDNPAGGIIISGQNSATTLPETTIGSATPTQTSSFATMTITSTPSPTQTGNDNNDNDNDGSDANDSSNDNDGSDSNDNNDASNTEATPTGSMPQNTGAASAVGPKAGLAAIVVVGAAALL